MSKTTETELEAIMSKPEYKNRIAIRVYEVGDNYVTKWEGKEIIAGNPFGLDSKLSDIGCPQPRNLFLMEEL